ncbi:ribonuclease E inhibitor RraA/Dimethylmenaquinone methyltransferase [Dendryphion nanum]|uniref:Cytochrome b-c1 complex subunit 6, mitochondrial n=1 Tax=Dendryphion nanum TaxID=256645 RepID=A0A9P9ECN4_9PLEO|nr:ribonuclease E inhibitor RraA/Dimethylmenaquinone methyltransferase [Dendryphion nanum]
MVSKASGSFPNPSPISEDTPASNLQDATPYSDLTSRDTIAIISQPPGQTCAVVGGIMAARVKYLGAQGIAVDGRVRDLTTLRELGLPVWSKGTSIIGAGAQTKFHAKDVPVKIGDVLVEPGDIIMIDSEENGVVSVPQTKIEAVLDLLPKLVEADERVTRDVASGVSVKEAFKRHRGFSHPSPDAEEPPQGGASTKSPASGTDEESGEEKEVNKADAKKGGESNEQGQKPGDKDEDDAEDEEEEEEETVDPKDTLEEECRNSKECHSAKHHYDECADRVTGQIENDGKANEDCVEEFFHLAHCATQCAAPKLFSQLK